MTEISNGGMSGRSAVVTGAAGGIGLAIAAALKSAGASVFMADVQSDALDTALAELDPGTGTVKTWVTDVADSEQVETMHHAALKAFGRINVLVNCAGIQFVSPLNDFPLDQWDRLMNVMLRGSFLCTQHFLPGMMSDGWGRVVNIASIHSVVGSKFKSAYVSAKHGLIGLTKTAALEAAESGVTVNAISPAYVRTSLVEKQIESQAELHGISKEAVVNEIMLAPMPQKELIDATEIGEIVLFLCSDAARHINGHNLVVDGGWTIT